MRLKTYIADDVRPASPLEGPKWHWLRIRAKRPWRSWPLGTMSTRTRRSMEEPAAGVRCRAADIFDSFARLQSHLLASANVVLDRWILSGRAIHVLRPVTVVPTAFPHSRGAIVRRPIQDDRSAFRSSVGLCPLSGRHQGCPCHL